MLLISSWLAIALQVGPNPQSTSPLGTPNELLDRPPRENAEAISPESQWLADCLALLPDEAARAHTLAQVRRNESSGPARVLANHCLGLAASELGRWEDAITAFIAARDETPAEEQSARARFGLLAGNAALASADAARARPLFAAAKNDAASAASANLQAIAATDLARVMVAQGENEAALVELNLATSLVPEYAESWLLKATLLRRMDRLEEAQAAIESAGAIGPQDPAIGLEAGVIAVLSGRFDAARASWQSVRDVAPGTLWAQRAEDYLAQLGPPAQEEPTP